MCKNGAYPSESRLPWSHAFTFHAGNEMLLPTSNISFLHKRSTLMVLYVLSFLANRVGSILWPRSSG